MSGSYTRPVVYLEKSFSYWYYLRGSSLHQFLISCGYTDPASTLFLNTYCLPNNYLIIHKGSRFITRLSRLPTQALLSFVIPLLKHHMLFFRRHFCQNVRASYWLLTRKRRTDKRKLVLRPSLTPIPKALKIPQASKQAIFIPHSPITPDVFPPIPPVLQTYCHSPILLFPRAGVG